jgi:hypothetical protein
MASAKLDFDTWIKTETELIETRSITELDHEMIQIHPKMALMIIKKPTLRRRVQISLTNHLRKNMLEAKTSTAIKVYDPLTNALWKGDHVEHTEILANESHTFIEEGQLIDMHYDDMNWTLETTNAHRAKVLIKYTPNKSPIGKDKYDIVYVDLYKVWGTNISECLADMRAAIKWEYREWVSNGCFVVFIIPQCLEQGIKNMIADWYLM